MTKALHIVCLSAPAPTDNGGAIDMFYKIRALYAAGIAVNLHYFSYRRPADEAELKKYCVSIRSYRRRTGITGISLSRPYIVSSRVNKKLIDNLNTDQNPVLLEGIHCTGIISRLNKNKRVLVRLHNNEADYYRSLAGSAGSLFKKFYYERESRLLEKYQSQLPQNTFYGCISETETGIFKDRYHLKNVFYLPVFTPYQTVTGKPGSGEFCLYHGNLSVSENDKAARWLVQNVFAGSGIPFIVAGKDPSNALKRMISVFKNVKLVENPGDEALEELIRQSHLNVLPSFSRTGIKLKLLHALFSGRHCLVNNEMLAASPVFRSVCETAQSAEEFISSIMRLFIEPFTGAGIEKRKRLLEENFDNSKNVQRIIQCLW